MAKKVLPAVLALILLLSACGSRLPSPTGTPAHQEPSPTVAPTPESTPYDGPVSPLSGLPMGKEWVNRRPVGHHAQQSERGPSPAWSVPS